MSFLRLYNYKKTYFGIFFHVKGLEWKHIFIRNCIYIVIDSGVIVSETKNLQYIKYQCDIFKRWKCVKIRLKRLI